MSKKINKIEVVFFEDIAQEVRNVEEAMRAIGRSGLTEKAITLLVSKLSGEGITTVNNVIWGLEHIGDYLKK